MELIDEKFDDLKIMKLRLEGLNTDKELIHCISFLFKTVIFAIIRYIPIYIV